jgi:hypothetical protein
MGGIGSGRRYYGDVKNTVESTRSIDIRCWQREGMLVPGKSFRWNWLRYGLVKIAEIRVWVESDRVMVAFDSQAEVQDCVIPLETTPCTYGGKRYWFRCPAEGCGRRVAVLYENWRSYECRHCRDFTYPSQRESPGYRAARRAAKIRMKMGGSGALLPPFPEKPKGMHWRTYWRLRKQAEESGGQFTLELNQRLKTLETLSKRLLDTAKEQMPES